MNTRRSTDSFETFVAGDGMAPVLLTCEHGSNRLPEPWSWPEEDRRLVDMHWAYDIGAADLTRELATRIGGTAVISAATRLLVDVNRALESPTLFRTEADGAPVRLNDGLTEAEKQRRIDDYYHPYHDEIRTRLALVRPQLIFAIHSFTPVYEGTPREVELGVLHLHQDELAVRWRDILARSGRDTRIDEPYAGSRGFMFSCAAHGEESGIAAMELEVRQDICGDPAQRGPIVALLHDMLVETGALTR